MEIIFKSLTISNLRACDKYPKSSTSQPFRPRPSFLTKLALKRLETSFYSVFRHVILSLLPAAEISQHFSTETVLYMNLRINEKRRYRRRAKNKRKRKILNRVGIEKMATALELRVRYGDWEVDFDPSYAGKCIRRAEAGKGLGGSLTRASSVGR